MKCPKCGGEMEKGKPSSYGGVLWVKDGKWTVFGAPQTHGYSCLKCGFIEYYVNRK